jgi:hypothetical protein
MPVINAIAKAIFRQFILLDMPAVMVYNSYNRKGVIP